MDNVMQHAGITLERMMGEKLTKLVSIEAEVHELKMKQMIGEDELAKLQNESIMAQDTINGINIMVESVRFEGEQVKKKQGDMRKELMQEIELIRKDIRQGGGQKFSGTKKQLATVSEDPEKKEESQVPSAEFIKLQDQVKEHERRLV